MHRKCRKTLQNATKDRKTPQNAVKCRKMPQNVLTVVANLLENAEKRRKTPENASKRQKTSQNAAKYRKLAISLRGPLSPLKTFFLVSSSPRTSKCISTVDSGA
jgi:peptide subunit release factor 1 (eRF1)